MFDGQEQAVLDELDSDAVKAAIASGAVPLIMSAIPVALLTPSTVALLSSMEATYLKAVEDNIEEGYGAPVSEQVSEAATSEHLAAVNNFNTTTQEEVAAALVTAAQLTDENDGDVDIALKLALAYSLIKAIFNKLRTKRQKLILDAAVLGPYNQGLYDSAVAEEQRTGQIVQKQWVSLMDERVRSAHRQLHGEKVAVGTPFIVNGVSIRFPKDPLAPPGLTINCRCILRFSR